MKRFLAVAALGLLAITGVAAAAFADTGSSSSSPAKQCRTEQADPNFAANHGGKTFAQFYGTNGNTKNAYGKCVSSKERAESSTSTTSSTTNSTTTESSTTTSTTTTSSSHSSTTFAAQCRAERTADPAAFKAKYGTNKNKSNAFGKCVSAKAKAHSHA